jgi:crotonobetainyl-CoA:carnitine CoA-transferase CaiB-like acyl-CoA transferase
MNERAFPDLSVLDLTEGIAGPYCTRLLADFGAEVIKIEKPKEGDVTRKWGPFLNDDNSIEKSGFFFYLNTNKKSITLNFENEIGSEIFKKLIKSSDILVENWAPGRLAKLGLSNETLTGIKPDLIITSISAFGQTGPYRDFASNNLTEFALGGAMYTMRPDVNPKQRPVIESGFQAEYATGVLSYIATVAALMGTADYGVRKSVDIGAMECVASTLMGHVSEYSYMGLSRRTCPFAIHGYPIGYSFPCRDGWVSPVPGIGGAPNIPLLIDRPDLQTDPLFTEPRTRMANPEEFNAMIIPWLMEHDKWDIATEAQQLRLAFTPILTCGELLEDRQLAAREFFNQIRHPIMGDVVYPGPPVKMSETPLQVGKAPLLGENNQEIYGRYGYTPDKLAQLREFGVI